MTSLPNSPNRLRSARALGAAAYGSTGLAVLYAVVSLYWAAGGTALLSTVGGELEQLGQRGGSSAALLAGAAATAKLGGGLLSLALVRPWGRQLPQRPLLLLASLTAGVLTLYGGVQVLAGSVALAGAFGPVQNPTPLRWHVFLWDLWFLAWGMLLTIAVVLRRRQRQASTSAQ